MVEKLVANPSVYAQLSDAQKEQYKQFKAQYAEMSASYKVRCEHHPKLCNESLLIGLLVIGRKTIIGINGSEL
jgi:hypothetical protein